MVEWAVERVRQERAIWSPEAKSVTASRSPDISRLGFVLSFAIQFLAGFAVGMPMTALGAMFGPDVSASCGTATGESISIGGDPSIQCISGYTPKELKEIIDGLARQSSEAQAKALDLSNRLGVTETVIRTFFAILSEKAPIEQLPERLVEIVTRHKQLLAQVERTVSSDPRVQELKAEAAKAIAAGEYDRAERLLNEAKDAALAAARRLKEEVATQLRAAAEATADNGKLALTRLGYREAAAYFAEAVDLLPEGSDEARADYLNQQGEAAWRGGDYRKAVEAHRAALDIRERIYAPDDPKLAYGLNELASAFHATSRYAEAEPLFQRAIAIDEKALGPEHPNLAVDLNNLALLYRDTGRLAEAEPLYERVLSMFEKALEPDHPNVATAANNLALLYWATGRLAEAELLFRRAITIGVKVLGPEHPNIATGLNNLANLYQDTGRLAEAEPLLKRAIAIDEETLGPEHPNFAIDLNNLALLYRDTGRYAEAEPLLKRAVAIDEKALGPEHPALATRLNNLAALYHAAGRYAEAEPLLKRALIIIEKTLPADHPYLMMGLENYAGLLDRLDRTSEAAELRTRAEAIRQQRERPQPSP